MQHIVFHENRRGESMSGWRQLSIVGCDEWQTAKGAMGRWSWGGGMMVHPRALSWLLFWPDRWPAEWEDERERESGKKKDMAWCGGRRNEGQEKSRDKRKAGKDNVGWPVLIFLWSEMKDTAAGVGGCQSGKEASSICHLYFSLSSRYLVFLPPHHFSLSTPLSCCFWLLVGVQQRQINRGDCLFLLLGNNCALLPLNYLALGYLSPLISYGKHTIMIYLSTLDETLAQSQLSCPLYTWNKNTRKNLLRLHIRTMRDASEKPR